LERLLYLPIIALALSAGMILFTALAWHQRYWHLAGRVHYTLLTFAAIALLFWLDYWNLLGFRY
jgi:hypothetical protein